MKKLILEYIIPTATTDADVDKAISTLPKSWDRETFLALELDLKDTLDYLFKNHIEYSRSPDTLWVDFDYAYIQEFGRIFEMVGYSSENIDLKQNCFRIEATNLLLMFDLNIDYMFPPNRFYIEDEELPF